MLVVVVGVGGGRLEYRTDECRLDYNEVGGGRLEYRTDK